MHLLAYHISAAQENQVETLTEIAIKAKSHWGYPATWIQEWKMDLTITPGYLRDHISRVVVATPGDEPLGFFCLKVSGEKAVLSHLWVVPSAMGKGIGSALFKSAESAGRDAGAKTISIESDPHAEGFYLHLGCKVIGRKAAPMDGQPRQLPVLEKLL